MNFDTGPQYRQFHGHRHHQVLTFLWMDASAKEPLGGGIRLLEPWSFGLIRKGWDVKVKDMEKVVLYSAFKEG